jgi:hypothetical protein
VAPSPTWITRRAAIAAQGPGVSHLQYVYPPIPVLLALALPGGALALAIVTCLFSGATMAILLKRVSRLSAAVVLAPLVCVPAMWYMASQLLPQVIGLTFLAVALQGFISFAAYGETYGGFIAGLALAVSYAADPGALLYAAIMCLTVPLISAGHFRGARGAPLGVGAVLVFPCVAMAASWSFLLWKFTGQWPGNLAYAPNAHILDFPGGVIPGMGHALVSALRDVIRAPLYLCAAALIALQRLAPQRLALHRRGPAAGLALPVVGFALPVVGIALALWLGFDYNEVTAYFMFTLLAATVITASGLTDSRVGRVALVAAAVIQIAIAAFAWPPESTGFDMWRHVLFG